MVGWLRPNYDVVMCRVIKVSHSNQNIHSEVRVASADREDKKIKRQEGSPSYSLSERGLLAQVDTCLRDAGAVVCCA